VFIPGIEKEEKEFTTRLDKVIAMKLEAVPVGFPRGGEENCARVRCCLAQFHSPSPLAEIRGNCGYAIFMCVFVCVCSPLVREARPKEAP
jgi:hypothetical protein